MESKVVTILTLIAVLLFSPLSFVFSFIVGVKPEVWLEVWLRYVFLFIVAAIGCSIVGLGIALQISTKKIKRIHGTDTNREEATGS